MDDKRHPELYCIISADIYYFNTGLELGLNEKKPKKKYQYQYQYL